VITVLASTAMHAIRPSVAYRALDIGASPFEVGLIAASYNLLALPFALPMGRLADRVGPERFAVVGLTITTIATVWLAVVDSVLSLASVFVLAGLGQTIILVAQQTTIANRGDHAGRAKRFGLYTSAASVGQILGPLVILLAVMAPTEGSPGVAGVVPEASGLTIVLLVCASLTALAALVGVPLAVAAGGRPRADEPPSSMIQTATRVLRRPGMVRAMLVSTVVVSSIDMLGAYLPVLGEAHGIPVATVSILLTLRAGATLASRVVISLPLRVLGPRLLLATGLSVAAAAMLLVGVAPTDWVLAGLMIAFGLGIGIGQPLTISWVADRSPRAERATAIGIRLAGNRLALLTIPIVMGAIAGTAGIGLSFVTVALLLAAGAAGALRARTLDQPALE
jgi:MFS family permease